MSVTLTTSYFGSRRRTQFVRRSVTWILLGMGFLWFVFPLAWLILGSLKSFKDLNAIPIRFVPTAWLWDNYVKAWTRVPFGKFYVNTIIITTTNVVGILVSCSLGGYGFARLQFHGRDLLFFLMLSTMMLPWWVTLIPTYLVFRQLGWIDSWLPLMVPSFFGSASAIFLTRQFFMTLPRELDEAAELDGCSRFGIFWRILLPLSRPVLATISIFTFMGSWNSYLQPLIYLHRPELFTLSLGLQFLRIAAAAYTGTPEPIQALVMAAGVFTSIPLIAIFFVGQKYFVQGIALTGRTGM